MKLRTLPLLMAYYSRSATGLRVEVGGNAVFIGATMNPAGTTLQRIQGFPTEEIDHLNSYFESITMDCTRASKSARAGT
jgi:hypothetical protein